MGTVVGKWEGNDEGLVLCREWGLKMMEEKWKENAG